MRWQVEKIIRFSEDHRFQDGIAHLGFHDFSGRYYAVCYAQHWVGEVSGDGDLLWTAGANAAPKHKTHIAIDLQHPTFAAGVPDGNVLVASGGNKRVYRIDPQRRAAHLVIDGQTLNIRDLGNCVLDRRGDIWINEITGCRVLKFNMEGELQVALGKVDEPGFLPGTVPFPEVRFNWIYDLRTGPDGNVYVLDSRNFAVRMIDITAETVTTLAGTGQGGYTGDGGDPRLATFGSSPAESFDGPWSLALDETSNIFIGDTQNHVVRMIERASWTIKTIAGRRELAPEHPNRLNNIDPLMLNLPRICSLDYHDGRLFIPEWAGELYIVGIDGFNRSM